MPMSFWPDLTAIAATFQLPVGGTYFGCKANMLAGKYSSQVAIVNDRIVRNHAQAWHSSA
jgi:hypothetical protein